MDLSIERRNTLEYLKEFNKSIPKKRALLLKIHSHKMVNVIFWGFGLGEKGWVSLPVGQL